MSRKIAISGMGNYDFRTPVMLRIEQESPDGRYWAYWPEIETGGYGMTETAAMAAVKDAAVSLYRALIEMPDERLSARALRWQAHLQELVKERVKA